jgi:hypothetical protein
MTRHLLERVRELLLLAGRDIAEPAARATVGAALRRLDEPLRVAIAGKVKAGKSTLLNAMVGEELAPTDAGECTKIVTWYRDGPAYRVTVHLTGGPAEVRPFRRQAGAIRVDLGHPAGRVDRLDVEVPSRRLREHTLIDTPGLASISAEVSVRTLAHLGADDEHRAQADAVVYLLRHMHSTDIRFLEAFRGDDLARGSPINAVGVLSRADEIGGCRLDAMTTAGTVAARYQADERLRRLCPIVVPVAGLLGAAGATLREEEFRTLQVVAGAPGADLVALLLTADRFVAPHASVPATEQAREQVLDRLGLFGVRLGVQLIREGAVRSADALARELTVRSGLDRLQEILAAQFLGRREVLKARSALTTLDDLLRSHRYDAGGDLAARAEEIRASAHEFVEIRLLHLLSSGRLPGPPDRLAEMERLLGGAGAEPAIRLGQPPDAPPDLLLAEVGRALQRWRRIAGHPMSVHEMRAAARATVRTCEGILATLQAPRPGRG